jgi:hypothetical protein
VESRATTGGTSHRRIAPNKKASTIPAVRSEIGNNLLTMLVIAVLLLVPRPRVANG